MSWGMSYPSYPNTTADNQLCLQLDHARYPPVPGMALGNLDQEGETSHQGRRCKCTPSTLWRGADGIVAGHYLLLRFNCLLHGLVLPVVCGSLWQIRSIRR
jgi:hypothetical protein